MSNLSKFNRAALVSAIALVLSAPTFAQTSGSPAGDSGGQTKAGAAATKAGATATTGTTSAAPAAPGSTGAADSKTIKSGTSTTDAARSSGAASGAASNSTTRGAPDKTNAKARSGATADMNSWTKSEAGENKGRVSRQAYMDEMGRRWDSVDRNHQGLTPAEVGRLTGKADADQSAMPRMGSDMQPANMGPSSVKAK